MGGGVRRRAPHTCHYAEQQAAEVVPRLQPDAPTTGELHTGTVSGAIRRPVDILRHELVHATQERIAETPGQGGRFRALGPLHLANSGNSQESLRGSSRLTHMDQQAAEAGGPRSELTVRDPHDVAERHAEAVSWNSPPASAISPGTRQEAGQPLTAAARSYFDARYHHNFDNVRVHHDDEAARSAATHRADAFTVGEDVYFAAGRYEPDSIRGRALLAHELAHVVQQADAARLPHAASQPTPVASAAERLAADAASRAVGGHYSPTLSSTPLGIARQRVRQPPGTTGKLRIDSSWSYIVYDSEIRLRYYRDLSTADAEKRAKKGLPGNVQVGAIPWITNNPGNVTQTPGAATTTLQGYPATSDIGSIGIYPSRYSIFPTTAAGLAALKTYLRKRSSFGTNPNTSMAQNIKNYKAEEPGEKARREAREKENAERQSRGESTLPTVDVREKYLADVKKRMQARIVAAEALGREEEVEQLDASQRRELEREASERINKFMQGRAADVAAGDPDLAHVVQSIYEVEGKAAVPGVRFTCAGFDDPRGSVLYDGEQKEIIKRLIESEAAKKELQTLLGCSS